MSYVLAHIGFNTAENEPLKVWRRVNSGFSSHSQSRCCSFVLARTDAGGTRYLEDEATVEPEGEEPETPPAPPSETYVVCKISKICKIGDIHIVQKILYILILLIFGGLVLDCIETKFCK